MIGLSLSRWIPRRAGGGGASVPLTSIDADGWQATYSGTPPSTTLNQSFTATGLPGFSDVGSAVSNVALSTGLRISRRLRVPGTISSLQALKVGISMVLPIGAQVAGVTVNSTRVPPSPVINFVTAFGQLIGNGDRIIEVVCGHYYARGGKQIACFEATMSDGTTTITQRSSTMVVLGAASDKKPVYGYRVTFPAASVATLIDGRIAYEANAYPIIGTSASVARTTDAATRGFPAWKFATKYDVKDATRFATPPRCYLDAAGNDTTGVWSTTDATAAAAPFATMPGALAAGKISAIPAGSVVPSGHVDGCIIFARAGTFNITAPATAVPQKGGELIVTRDPAAAASTVIFTHAGAYRLRLGQTGLYTGMTGAVRFEDCKYNRTAAGAANGDTQRTQITLSNVIADWGALNNVAWGATVDTLLIGTIFSNIPANSNSAMNISNGGGPVLIRGCTLPLGGSGLAGYNIIGNAITNVGAFAKPVATFNNDNSIVAFNVCTGDIATSISYGNEVTVTGVLILGNSFEWVSTVSDPIWRCSADGDLGNTIQFLEYQNSYGGAAAYGRHNDRYVDTDATGARTHTWGRSENNILIQHNTKHDRFDNGTNGGLNPARIGGWEVAFGVGYGANLYQYQDASGGGATNFGADWYSPAAQVGTSATVPIDPRWKLPRHVILSPLTTGVGGGDYRLMRISEGDAFNSPCLTMAEIELLPGFGTVIGAYP